MEGDELCPADWVKPAVGRINQCIEICNGHLPADEQMRIVWGWGNNDDRELFEAGSDEDSLQSGLLDWKGSNFELLLAQGASDIGEVHGCFTLARISSSFKPPRALPSDITRHGVFHFLSSAFFSLELESATIDDEPQIKVCGIATSLSVDGLSWPALYCSLSTLFDNAAAALNAIDAANS